MGEDSEELKKKKALSLMADYLDQRDAIHEGPRFHTPPFIEKRIEGTKTIYYAPVEDSGSRPREPEERPRESAPARPVQPQISGPVSFRRPFVKPDAVIPQRRPGLASFDRRPSARELIAKLRVVKEGVETRREVMEKMSGRPEAGPAEADSAEATPPDAAAGAQPALVEESEEKGVPEQIPELKPAEGPLTPEAEKAAAARSEGGKLCPSCGTPISDKNRLFICNDCGKKTCDTCGGFELTHMKSDVFYDYKFDWPLCITCYDKAYQIQRNLGKAIICYGNGNYSYSLYYANAALVLDPESKYAAKAREIIDRISDTREQTAERDKEWRIARKHFMRQPVEDPRWK